MLQEIVRRKNLPRLCLLTLVLACGGVFGQASNAVNYDIKQELKFSYNVTLTIERAGGLTWKGQLHYHVVSKSEKDITLMCVSNLGLDATDPLAQNRVSFSTINGVRRVEFGGPAPERLSEKLTINPLGKLRASEAEASLPLLLGRTAHLPIDVLPDSLVGNWSSESEVAIKSTALDDTFRLLALRFVPQFGSAKTVIGTRKASFENISNDFKILKAKKNIELSTAQVEGHPDYELMGVGTWSFNLLDHVPQDSEMKYTFTRTFRGHSISVPFTLSIKRLSQEDLAKLKADEAARIKSGKELAERLNRRMTSEEIAETLKVLRSDDLMPMARALAELYQRKNLPQQKELALEVDRLTRHDHHVIKSIAKQVFDRFDANVVAQVPLAVDPEINEIYKGPGFVPNSRLPVGFDTPIYVGQILQIKNGAFCHPAVVKEILPGHMVKVGYRGWSDHRDKVVSKTSLQLAPKEVIQPDSVLAQMKEGAVAQAGGDMKANAPPAKQDAQPKDQMPAKSANEPVANSTSKSGSAQDKPGSNPDDPKPIGQLRLWTDATGKYKVEAELISYVDKVVTIKRKDHKLVKLPFEKLSKDDQAYVIKLTTKDPDNPFDP